MVYFKIYIDIKNCFIIMITVIICVAAIAIYTHAIFII